MTSEDTDQIRRDFAGAVNMSSTELRHWLDTDESTSVGDTGGKGESTGHEMGRRILGLQSTNAGDLSDDDLAAMKKVTGYVHRHLAQEPGREDVQTSKWRYSLMNWGHDPLK